MNSNLTLPAFGSMSSAPNESLLPRLVFRMVEKIDGWRRYHRTARELRGLSDFQLNDIGIERADIEGIARKF
ncbi:MAG: DUF1127 domain-containing protein [Geminicoccaceae bacterium]|nr:DUF1127 domain-containing protein [Geminicoccaceae bacterium]